MTTDWSDAFLAVELAKVASDDPVTQVGAVLCHPDGAPIPATRAANRLPWGTKRIDHRRRRPGKFNFMEHAERNALFAAASTPLIPSTQGLVMVCDWAACAECARAIIQCGIVKLVTYERPTHRSDWDQSVSDGDLMLLEAGVTLELVARG